MTVFARFETISFLTTGSSGEAWSFFLCFTCVSCIIMITAATPDFLFTSAVRCVTSNLLIFHHIRSSSNSSPSPPLYILYKPQYYLSQLRSPSEDTRMSSTLQTKPPKTPSYVLSYPKPHVLLITINRPHAMNSLPWASHWEADDLLTWFDNEPSLRVAVVTGAKRPGNTNPRKDSFCAGQDLIESGRLRIAELQGREPPPHRGTTVHPRSGFMAISRRAGKKPVICAVNGFAMGGGFEICLGADMVVASPYATFALPEASRGLYAAAGGLSKLVRLVGMMVATEVALAGRVLGAEEAARLGVVNRVSATHGSLLDETLELAGRIGELSPDAVIVSRHGLRMAWEEASVERAAQKTEELYGEKLRHGENIRIGLEAFANKQKPKWVDSKL